MKILKMAIVMTVLVISIGGACAADSISDDGTVDGNLKTAQQEIDNLTETQNSLSDLKDDIDASGNALNIDRDYAFDSQNDNKTGVKIDRNDYTINGNGHTVDGGNGSRIFLITGKNITINDLIISNGNSKYGGAIFARGSITLNNVTFIKNNASVYGGGIYSEDDIEIKCNGCRFIDNYAEAGSAIYSVEGTVNVLDTYMSSKMANKYAQIAATDSLLMLDNATFENITGTYSPAIYMEDSYCIIKNSRFRNLAADLSAGAIAIRSTSLSLMNCEFTNTSSSKNAGAIHSDIAGAYSKTGDVIIVNCIFRDTFSSFGGAYIQLGGNLLLNNTLFANSWAFFNGGAAYLSYVNATVDNCTFHSNGVATIEDYPTYGGALYVDMTNLTLYGSRFINNTANLGNAIFLYDSNYSITGTAFENNTNDIYTMYDKNITVLDANTYSGNDSVSQNNTDYDTYVEGMSVVLNLTNNTIDVADLPVSFDLRDWGWVTPVRNQGWMGACWTFGMIGAMESALLKNAGISTDISENNMQNTMLRYSRVGANILEGGDNTISSSYLLSWLGAFSQDADEYDEVGKLSPLIITKNDIHVQDVIFIPKEIPNGTQLKLAILKYGALDVCYYGQSRYDEANPWFNDKTSAQYCTNQSLTENHEVTLIGWDDAYPKENFIITPPGDGAWIIKNSWGTDWGDKGYLYVSYYDATFLKSTSIENHATAVLFENTVPYNKNYQHEFAFNGLFINSTDYGVENMTFSNLFTAIDDDLIAAVGTYFPRAGIPYEVQIYVNDELKLTQEGISPYYGYHTIKLDKYIPVMEGDEFEAVMTTQYAPFIKMSMTRVHGRPNTSLFKYPPTGEWYDLFMSDGAIFNIKVYTVADDSEVTGNVDIEADYGQCQFSVEVVNSDGHSIGEGAVVEFEINGKIMKAETDGDGIAKINISEVPGTYAIKTSYNGRTYNNTVVVKLNPNACKVTENRDITVDYDGGSYFSVKVVSDDGRVACEGASVKFTINGRTTLVKTDAGGIARIKITDVPKKYAIITEFNGKAYKNTVTVKQVLKSKKVTVKRTAKKLTLRATLKINGKLQKGKVITFKFNGKTYKAKTDRKGVAKKTLKSKVIKKLRKGKKYTVKVTYLKDTIKTTVKVK